MFLTNASRLIARGTTAGGAAAEALLCLLEMSKPIEDKRFTRGEVELIVRRAAELQERTPSAERLPEGSSLAEIQALAAQLGIDPAGVKTAALELYRPQRAGLGALIWGSPMRLKLSRVVPRAIAKESFEALMLAIQSEMDDAGNVALVGNTLTWSSTGQRPVRKSITISSSAERTTMTMEIHGRQLAGGLYGGIGGGVGGGVGGNALVWTLARHSALLGVVTGAVFLGSYLLPRFIFQRVMAGHARRGEALLDRLEAQIARQ